MAGVGVIINGTSRGARRTPGLAGELARVVGDQGTVVVTRDLEQLAAAASRFAADGLDVLAVYGGDGTIHNTLTAAIAAWGEQPLPPIVVLRGGTVNTVARGLGVTGPGAEPTRLLAAVMARVARGASPAVRRRAILRVNERHGFLFGNGAIHAFMRAYYEAPRPDAMSAAVLLGCVVGSAVIGGPLAARIGRRFAARVTEDGAPWAPRDYLLIAAATVPEFGLGFVPFPHWNARPGGFAAVGIHARPTGVIADLPRLYRGRPMRPEHAVTSTPRLLRIETDEPVGYMIDGDVYCDATVVEVAAGPQLDIVVPG